MNNNAIKKTIFLVLFVWLSSSLLAQTTQKTEGDVELDPSITESIDGIVNALYDFISAAPGEREWSKFKTLFLPDARIISITKDENREDKFYNVHIDDYIKNISPVLKDKTYYEIEIGRQMEEYNNIASVFSTFQSTLIEGENITVKTGINSMQLVFYQNRWWIASVLWNNETKEELLPERYKVPPKKSR